MDVRYKNLREMILKELSVAEAGSRDDPSEDFAIEANLENFLNKEPKLIAVVIDCFSKSEIVEFKLKLATVILDHCEHVPSYKILIEDGRTAQWLSGVYVSVQDMIKKGLVSV